MEDTSVEPLQKRARLACTVCNTRRVKCDATENQPCRNYNSSNFSCEERKSRREKRPRKPIIPGELSDIKSRLYPVYNLDDTDVSPLRLATSQDYLIAEAAASCIDDSLLELDRSRCQHPSPGQTFEDKSDIEELGPKLWEPSTGITNKLNSEKEEEELAVFLEESTSFRCVMEHPAPTFLAHKRPRLRHSVSSAVERRQSFLKER